MIPEIIDAHGLSNILWAMAKVNNKQLIPDIKRTLYAALPHLEKKENQFTSQQTATLFWAFGKLSDNWLQIDEKLQKTLYSLLSNINYNNLKHDQRVDQAVSNTFWALSKLIDNGLEFTERTEKAIEELLYCVQCFYGRFMPQGSANTIWSIAKIAKFSKNNSDLQQSFITTLNLLLPFIRNTLYKFKSQGLSNTVWSISKLLDHEFSFALKDQLHQTYFAILPNAIKLKDYFKPQEIANLIWSTINVVQSRCSNTEDISILVRAFSPQIKKQYKEFKPQEVSNLLWAISSLGDLITPLKAVYEIFEYLLKNPSFNQSTNFSYLEARMTLWGLLVLNSRFYLAMFASRNNPMDDLYQEQLQELFVYLQSKDRYGEKDISLLVMASSWLKEPLNIATNYRSTSSSFQTRLYKKLVEKFPSYQIEQEVSIKDLPPVDIMIRKKKLIIEVQGPHHYIDLEYKIRNGNTLLKNSLYKKLGFKVVEFPIFWIDSKNNELDLFLDNMKKILS